MAQRDRYSRSVTLSVLAHAGKSDAAWRMLGCMASLEGQTALDIVVLPFIEASLRSGTSG